MATWVLRSCTQRSVRQARQVCVMARPAFVDGPGSASLRGRSCGGKCDKDVPKLEEAELAEHMPALPAWELATDKASISRSFTAKNFVAAIDFFNGVKEVAEAEGHHPDLHLTDYRSVRVVVATHSVGGLTMFDLILASKIDEVEVTYSPKWLREREAAAVTQ